MDQLNKQFNIGILPNELCFNKVNSGTMKPNYYIISGIKYLIFMVQSFLKSGSMINYFTQLLNQYQIMQKILM